MNHPVGRMLREELRQNVAQFHRPHVVGLFTINSNNSAPGAIKNADVVGKACQSMGNRRGLLRSFFSPLAKHFAIQRDPAAKRAKNAPLALKGRATVAEGVWGKFEIRNSNG